MADPEARLLERGFFTLYVSDGAGELRLTLSPEGDSHRLIVLQRAGGRLRGRVLAVVGRLAAIHGLLPRAATIAVAGRYRLDRQGPLSRLSFAGEEGRPDRAPVPLVGEEGWSLRVSLPPGPLERGNLPPDVLTRFAGQIDSALEQPDALDYAGMRLSLTPVEAALIEAGQTMWRGRAAVGGRLTR